MSKKSYSKQYYAYEDFEVFLTEFSQQTKGPELRYLTDEIFHLLLPRKSGKEKRFKGGILIWALWVLCRWIREPKTDKVCNSSNSSAKNSLGFWFLATPAHHYSLAPIVEQCQHEERLIYGDASEAELDAPRAPSSILDQSPTLRVLLGALIKTLRTTLQIRRTVRWISNKNLYSIPSGFDARMAETVYRQLLGLALLKQTTCKHRAVFLSYELTPEAKAWVQWARQSGARVIHVMHGQRLPTYQITMATDLVLFSKIDEPWFRKRVPSETKLWTIGHPRLEHIRSQIDDPSSHVLGRKPRLAYFSQPAEGDYSSELRKADWSILQGLKGKAEIRFRLHPRESRQAAITDLESLGIDFVEISDEGLYDDLNWSDAVVSSWSSVSMEAAVCGRGIFWACSTPEKYDASEELRAAGIGTLVQSSDDWSQHLDTWHNTGWDYPTRVCDEQLKDLGMIGDMQKSFSERLGLES